MKRILVCTLALLSINAFAEEGIERAQITSDFEVTASARGGGPATDCSVPKGRVYASLKWACVYNSAKLIDYDISCRRVFKEWEATGVGYCSPL